MRALVVADCCLVDLNGIEACPLLQLLDASGNSISSIEHLAESGLTQLTSLKLQSNDIENLDALDNAPFMNTLTHLDLNHNEISSLTPLGGYASLSFLDVSSNKVIWAHFVKFLSQSCVNYHPFARCLELEVCLAQFP